jgi:hypothetical protein
VWTAPFLQHQPKAVVCPCGSIGRSGLLADLRQCSAWFLRKMPCHRPERSHRMTAVSPKRLCRDGRCQHQYGVHFCRFRPYNAQVLNLGNGVKKLKPSLVGFLVLLVCVFCIFEFKSTDRFSWPKSAHNRIEGMASTLRSIEGPAKWCSPSGNSLSLLNHSDNVQSLLNECIASILPASEFEEIWPRDYMRRFYRAPLGDKFCEVTLSTVWNNDRIVGSDCYYGLFYKREDTGVGLTADPFG